MYKRSSMTSKKPYTEYKPILFLWQKIMVHSRSHQRIKVAKREKLSLFDEKLKSSAETRLLLSPNLSSLSFVPSSTLAISSRDGVGNVSQSRYHAVTETGDAGTTSRCRSRIHRSARTGPAADAGPGGAATASGGSASGGGGGVGRIEGFGHFVADDVDEAFENGFDVDVFFGRSLEKVETHLIRQLLPALGRNHSEQREKVGESRTISAGRAKNSDRRSIGETGSKMTQVRNKNRERINGKYLISSMSHLFPTKMTWAFSHEYILICVHLKQNEIDKIADSFLLM